VAGYRSTESELSIDIRQELNIFNIRGKIKEYQPNYLEYILRTPINRIPQKLFYYLPNGEKER
jgi:hypothetical protein